MGSTKGGGKGGNFEVSGRLYRKEAKRLMLPWGEDLHSPLSKSVLRNPSTRFNLKSIVPYFCSSLLLNNKLQQRELRRWGQDILRDRTPLPVGGEAVGTSVSVRSVLVRPELHLQAAVCLEGSLSPFRSQGTGAGLGNPETLSSSVTLWNRAGKLPAKEDGKYFWLWGSHNYPAGGGISLLRQPVSFNRHAHWSVAIHPLRADFSFEQE